MTSYSDNKYQWLVQLFSATIKVHVYYKGKIFRLQITTIGTTVLYKQPTTTEVAGSSDNRSSR